MAITEKQVALVESIIYHGTDLQVNEIKAYCEDLIEFREALTEKREER